jgi:phospholipase/carboxylesterase
VAHGDLDTTLPVVWAQRSDQWLKELGVQTSSHRYPIGHSISAAMQVDFLNWVKGLSQPA